MPNIFAVIGWILALSPFVGLFVFMWKESGIKVALIVYGACVGLMILFVIAGLFLQMGGAIK